MVLAAKVSAARGPKGAATRHAQVSKAARQDMQMPIHLMKAGAPPREYDPLFSTQPSLRFGWSCASAQEGNQALFNLPPTRRPHRQPALGQRAALHPDGPIAAQAMGAPEFPPSSRAAFPHLALLDLRLAPHCLAFPRLVLSRFGCLLDVGCSEQ